MYALNPFLLSAKVIHNKSKVDFLLFILFLRKTTS